MASTAYHAIDDEELIHPADNGRKSGLIPRVSCNLSAAVLFVVFYLSTIVVTFSASLYFNGRLGGLRNERLKETSFYSPFLDRMDIPLVEKQIDARLLTDPSDPKHIYRLPPSPEVDAAWERISRIGLHSISGTDVSRLRKNTTIAVAVPPSWTTASSSPSYLTEIDGFHQLHCLNMLRKALVLNYDHYWGQHYGASPPLTFANHLTHCLDMVRQNLMCHADVEAVTYEWRRGQRKPFADFAVWKSCRDWDAVMAWQEANTPPLEEDVERWDGLVKPEGVVQLEAPRVLEVLGNGTGERGGRRTQVLDVFGKFRDYPI